MVTSRSLIPDVSSSSTPTARHLQKFYDSFTAIKFRHFGLLRACKHERGSFRNNRIKRAEATRFSFNLSVLFLDTL